MLKNKVCIITASQVIYKIFSYLGSGFPALEYHSPIVPASTPLSYIVHNMATHVQANAFAGTRGGTMFHKTFPNSYSLYFENDCSNPKIDHEAFEMDNQTHCHRVSNPTKLNRALKDN